MPSTARRALLAFLACAVVAASGCSLFGEGATLDGTDWHLVGWSVSSLDPAAFDITASFADGQISGRAAVNQYGGPYATGPGDAFSTGALSSTLMAGEEPAMRAESAFFELLGQARAYRLEADTLTLVDDGGNELLVFARGIAEL